MAKNNMTVVREALKLCGSRMCRLCKELELARSMLNKRPLGVFCHSDKCKAYQAAHAALALPPRQCDIGTAEEQGGRFNAFCKKDCDRCSACPKATKYGIETPCYLIWAQMPYEEGGNDGTK